MHLITYAYSIASLAIAIAYLNARYIKMQTTVAVMVASLLIALCTVLLHHTHYMPLTDDLIHAIQSIHFSDVLLDGFLGFLLFSASLNIDLKVFKELKWDIGILATLSTILSTMIIGFACYIGIQYLAPTLGLTPLSLLPCLLFGALISPTDPIAVLATLKALKAPTHLTARLAGESLFNDGVGIVLFLVLFNMHQAHEAITFWSTLTLFIQQACGGLMAGYFLAWLYQKLLYNTHDHKMNILITLMITTGGYSLTHALSLSGPIAMVVSGLLIGQYSKAQGDNRKYLSNFWEIIDEVLNIILFFLLGFEMILIDWSIPVISIMLAVIPLVLATRWLTVALPIHCLKSFRQMHPMTTKILVWGGLRGGLSVALALSLPNAPDHNVHSLILAMTFSVVLFSILIQATTIPKLIKKLNTL